MTSIKFSVRMHSANLSPDRQIFFYSEGALPRSPFLVVGTIHRVPELQGDLIELLLELQPEIITVEISPYSLRRRQKSESHWLELFENLRKNLPPSCQKSPALELFQETLRLPYEWRAAQEAAQRLKVPVVPVDRNQPARHYLAQLEKLLTLTKLLEIAKAPVFSATKEFALARLSLTSGLDPKGDPQREAFMARKIRTFFRRFRPLVHIGGWRHLPGLLEHLPEAKGLLLDFRKDQHSTIKRQRV